MKTLILQNLTHRGTVPAKGFLFSAKILPEPEMRRRILSLWQTGAKVFRRGADLILLLPQPVRVDCRRTLGLPLVEYDREILSSFPLRKQDLERFQNSGTIVWLNQGRIETFTVGDLQIDTVENWFDFSDFQTLQTETLGEVRAKPAVIEKVEEIDLRRQLKDVPQADREMAEILQVLKQKKEEIAKAKNGSMFQAGNSSGSLAEAFGGVFDALKNLFSGKGGQNWQSFDEHPKPPGKLRKFFTKALFQMKIAQMIGRKQAQYLSKMMEMFENGDLEEALKYAISLEDMQSLKEMSEQIPFLGFLRPRQNLQINYGRQTASNSSVILENQWFDHLRELYRQTFNRLAAQKRIEEAAFVLAELLKSHHEAVEFLEKHSLHRLAAELAESRNLPKEIVVRQWFLAGEKRKAIGLAVLHNSFEYVVAKLEQEKHPQAAELRQIWAENLAASGNFRSAINIIWQLEDKRELAESWIDKTIEFGGAAAAEMLAKKITLFPESFNQVKTKLGEILADGGGEAEEQRLAFAREALRLSPNNELRTLVRPLARKILADMSHGFRQFSSQDFRQLVELSGDYALRTDLPKLSEIVGRKEAEKLTFEIAENDRGANRIYDACLLPNGKIAVALGEAGVKILSRRGKTIAHFDQPTQKFVVSDFGTKAICLARRGAIYRLAKIDFVERKAVYWCDAKIENFAPTFDGNLWLIAEKDEVYAIDTNAESFEAVWRVAEIGGQIYQISRSKTKLMLLIFNEKGFEKWWYDLPQFVLRSRNAPKWFEMENENQSIHSVSSSIAHAIVQTAEITEEQKKFQVRVYDYDNQMTKFYYPSETAAVGNPQIVEKIFALSAANENTAVIRLYQIPSTLIAEFILPRREDQSVRLDEKHLTITDGDGHVLIFDYKEKILSRNLRF